MFHNTRFEPPRELASRGVSHNQSASSPVTQADTTSMIRSSQLLGGYGAKRKDRAALALIPAAPAAAEHQTPTPQSHRRLPQNLGEIGGPADGLRCRLLLRVLPSSKLHTNHRRSTYITLTLLHLPATFGKVAARETRSDVQINPV